nr:hypothetical protein [Pandoravirus belohorizontensis]
MCARAEDAHCLAGLNKKEHKKQTYAISIRARWRAPKDKRRGLFFIVAGCSPLFSQGATGLSFLDRRSLPIFSFFFFFPQKTFFISVGAVVLWRARGVMCLLGGNTGSKNQMLSGSFAPAAPGSFFFLWSSAATRAPASGQPRAKSKKKEKQNMRA